MEIKKELISFIKETSKVSDEIYNEAQKIGEPGFCLIGAAMDLISALVLARDYIRLDKLKEIIAQMANETLDETIEELEKIKKGWVN